MTKTEALAQQVREIVESYDPRITEAAARFDIRGKMARDYRHAQAGT
jgi:predicted component of type VI protein secretion system